MARIAKDRFTNVFDRLAQKEGFTVSNVPTEEMDSMNRAIRNDIETAKREYKILSAKSKRIASKIVLTS